MRSDFARRLLSALPWLLLAGCFTASLYFSSRGWNLPLTDHWRFRETQTALSARSILENGFALDYETPVLGAPWSIPFEFPTYQLCTAVLANWSGLPLEQAGRLVSLLFAYLAFAFLGLLVARVSRSRVAGIYAASLALVSPVYLYGSRAFMIESTALCFTLAWLVGVQQFLRRPRAIALLWILLAGAVAGPTKATTYAVGLLGGVILFALHARAAWNQLRGHPSRRRLAAGFAAALAIPFFLTLAWTAYTDAVKSRNEFAAFITSSALRDWNFGTWAQRLDLHVWDQTFHWITHFVLGTPLAWLVGLVLLALAAPARPVVALFATMSAAGVLVFTNLFFVHEYYHYATGVYLLALFAVALGALWDRNTPIARLLAGGFAAPLLAGLMLWGYVTRSLPEQLEVDTPLLDLAAAVEKHTPPGSAIIVYGSEWESTLPYYARRHALMERYNLPPDDPMLRRALERLDRPLGGVVFTSFYNDDWTFVLRQLQGLGVGRQRLFTSPAGQVFAAAENPALQSAAWQRAGFADAPGVFESAFQVAESNYAGRNAMMVHAPGLFVLPREARHRSVTFGFGLLEAAYTGPNKTDGVVLTVDFVDREKRRTCLFERHLDPANRASDRGPQTATVALPADLPGALVFTTGTGASASFDWAVWHDVGLD